MPQRKYFNDEWTLDDFVSHADHVKSVANIINDCTPPYVLGIHGDWGAGKTSFLRKLHLYLSGKNCGYEKAEDAYLQLWGENYKANQNIETIWFDAWRYQFESNPVVALLNEIRSHFAMSKKLTGEAAKLMYAALMSMDDLTKKIGASPEKIMAAGEKWEQQHFSQPLPSQLFRDLLEQAIATLLGRKKSGKRLVIFVDDLDRCMGLVAFRFLEAMKIYLSLSNCVFVLGIDMRHVRRAVAAELKNAKVIPDNNSDKVDKAEIYAADYLGKMFQHVFYLPGVANFEKYLDFLIDGSILSEKEKWIKIITDYKLLPPNPRKVKIFISGLTFYTKQVSVQFDNWNKDCKEDEKQKFERKLMLIFAYLKFMANDLYRILEVEKDFWTVLHTFCVRGHYLSGERNNDNVHWALGKLTLPETASADQSNETGYGYQSAYPDPADEGLFRAGKLIREFRNGASPTDDEFRLYLLQA